MKMSRVLVLLCSQTALKRLFLRPLLKMYKNDKRTKCQAKLAGGAPGSTQC